MPDHPKGEETSDGFGHEAPARRNRDREANRQRRQRERVAALEARRLARSHDDLQTELKYEKAQSKLRQALTGNIDFALAEDIDFPVSIYLADERIHDKVEASVEQWLADADVWIDERHEPVIGSWFRSMEGRVRRAAKTPAAQEALLTATHIADSHLVQAHDAYVTATLLQNVGPVLQALQPTKDAVVRAGALLIVKIDWVVQVHQLTAAQQAILDHQPKLAASPSEIIAALELRESNVQEAAMQPIPRRNSGGETAATAANRD